MSFQDDLAFSTTILGSRSQYTIPTDDIISLDAKMTVFGFKAKLCFWCKVDDNGNDIFDEMISLKQCEIRISFQSILNQPDEKPDPLMLRGPVINKSIEEYTFTSVTDTPVLYRYFEVEFTDPASVYWKEHFPSEIHVSSSMSEVLDKHCPDGVNLTKIWPGLEAVDDIIALHLPPDNGASFYDFIMWYTDTHDGSINYDNQTNTYYLLPIKPSGADSEKMPYSIVKKLKIVQPRIPRHEVSVLNSYTEESQSSSVEQSYSVSGIRHDHLIRTPISSDFTLKESLESSRLRQPGNELEVELKAFPWLPYAPGCAIETAQTDWPQSVYNYNSEMKVKELNISISAIEEEPDVGNKNDSVECNVSINILLEDRTCMYVNFPKYTPPVYPLQAEGKVISEIGEDSDTTFNLYTNDVNSLDYYSIYVPCWNKEVPVLLESDYLPPHFFFPAYRDARVMLSFNLNKAEIQRFIEFGPRVQMPMDSQGNHILFGFNEQSQTAISHMYIDNKPILDIERNTEGESELIRFSDGTILIQTESDESSLSTSSGTDLTPNAEAAKADATINSQASMADATAVFDDTKDAIKDDLSSAKSDCQSAMEDAEAIIEDKMNQASTVVEGAASQLGESVAALDASYQDMKTELQSLFTL